MENFPTVEHENFTESLGKQSFHSDSNLLVGLSEGGNDSVVAEIITDDFHYITHTPHELSCKLLFPNLLRFKL